MAWVYVHSAIYETDGGSVCNGVVVFQKSMVN